jgi:hypothetical protein
MGHGKVSLAAMDIDRSVLLGAASTADRSMPGPGPAGTEFPIVDGVR